jgi:hypothetical protein
MLSELIKIANNQPYPLLFAIISGSHLYGFPSPDSDYDLRGCHILPVQEIIGLNTGKETIEISQKTQELELDLVTHDLKKFLLMLLKKNGYVLEQLYSPLIVCQLPEHQELKDIAKNCLTKYHSHHYLGFALTQWRLFAKENPPRVKPLLYVYRTLLTGIYLMKTGKIEANLSLLNQEFQLPYIDDLISLKLSSVEKSLLPQNNFDFYLNEYNRLHLELENAYQNTSLPEKPSAKNQLQDLLLRLRIKYS